MSEGNEDTCQSVSDKLWYMETLAVYIESLRLNLSVSESDEVYAIVDGLTSNMIYRLLDGKCSLKTSLEWSVDRIESYIDKSIESLYEILYRYNLI